MKYKVAFFLFVCGMLAFWNCNSVSEPVTSSTPPADVVEESEKIFIKDRTGKSWDVTHAVNDYGFKAAEFQYGLGPMAIRPIMNPQFVQDGESGFPGANNTSLIMGTEINGDSRAYHVGLMSRYEVANDTFGDSHVAVSY